MNKKEEFIDIFKNNIKRDGYKGADELLNFLEKSDFFDCPASTRFHSNIEHGLCLHSINVYNRLKQLVVDEAKKRGYGEDYWKFLNIDNDMKKVVNNSLADESIAIMGLLHDICKVDTYKVDYKNVKVDGEWVKQPFYAVNDELPYGHGEKSVYMISPFIELNRAEAMAINWHMSGFDMRVKGGSYSIGDAYYKFPVAVLLATADIMASYLDEKIY